MEHTGFLSEQPIQHKYLDHDLFKYIYKPIEVDANAELNVGRQILTVDRRVHPEIARDILRTTFEVRLQNGAIHDILSFVNRCNVVPLNCGILNTTRLDKPVNIGAVSTKVREVVRQAIRNMCIRASFNYTFNILTNPLIYLFISDMPDVVTTMDRRLDNKLIILATPEVVGGPRSELWYKDLKIEDTDDLSDITAIPEFKFVNQFSRCAVIEFT